MFARPVHKCIDLQRNSFLLLLRIKYFPFIYSLNLLFAIKRIQLFLFLSRFIFNNHIHLSSIHLISPESGCSQLSGLMTNALKANSKKTTPPTMVTVRTDIRCAIMRPPMTASPVQRAWPRTPPTMTPYALSRAASTIVDNCDRSPHSATNVIVKAWIRIRITKNHELFVLGFLAGDAVAVSMSTVGSSMMVTTPCSTSGSSVVETASFSNYRTANKRKSIRAERQAELVSMHTSSSRFFRSACTSSSSSWASFGDMFHPSRIIFSPKIANKAVEM